MPSGAHGDPNRPRYDDCDAYSQAIAKHGLRAVPITKDEPPKKGEFSWILEVDEVVERAWSLANDAAPGDFDLRRAAWSFARAAARRAVPEDEGLALIGEVSGLTNAPRHRREEAAAQRRWNSTHPNRPDRTLTVEYWSATYKQTVVRRIAEELYEAIAYPDADEA